MTAAWFFGANAARQPAYDPATGVTIDGIAEDGTVNRNSGAESTIHGLLTMLALDAHPSVRRIATQSSEVQGVVGTQYVQAEDGTLGAGATAVVPTAFWTGEAQYDGSGYVDLADQGSETLALGAHPRSLVIPVFDLRPDSSARTAFSAGDRPLGAIRSDSIGPQGDSPRRVLSCRGRWTRPCPPRRTPSRCARRPPPATSPGWTPYWSSHSSPGSCSAARDTAPLSCGARHGR